ncbi:hypothetical protein OOT00_15140 [Desulfobotulus sp. H1]|uniref:4Fe-4S ferredoxin-type domain-containing protein n=1 Tax=Desulfobotulus pelophilus TaxID=2823377 RepID=A0ABT3NCY1_9BACT|nr:hypothetical protein [Desulfobotulus pelophilus]MCW7755317.1 hypothetical protein [Desulfobotulus pelophilus]
MDGNRHQKPFIKRDRFDFEVGYLTQSPCLTCIYRETFPSCFHGCLVLDAVQTRLAEGIELGRCEENGEC